MIGHQFIFLACTLQLVGSSEIPFSKANFAFSVVSDMEGIDESEGITAWFAKQPFF
jgi:hypothetical protein